MASKSTVLKFAFLWHPFDSSKKFMEVLVGQIYPWTVLIPSGLYANHKGHSRKRPARGGSAPGADEERQSRRRRREQSPSTNPALFLRGGGAASVLPGRTPTQHNRRRSHNTNIFCKGETSPDLHSLILLAGDIEQNSGPPTYPCPVCHRAYSRCRGAVQCTVCQQWLCLSQYISGISRIRHYTPGWICQGCQPQTQPLTSSIPYSPVQTARSTQTPQRAVVHSFSSSTSFPPVHSHSPSSVQGNGGSVLGPSACQVRADSSTPTLMPVLRPSGMSPGTGASASPHPGPSGPPALQAPLALQAAVMAQSLGYHLEQHWEYTSGMLTGLVTKRWSSRH